MRIIYNKVEKIVTIIMTKHKKLGKIKEKPTLQGNHSTRDNHFTIRNTIKRKMKYQPGIRNHISLLLHHYCGDANNTE
jgi:hypothetical protein